MQPCRLQGMHYKLPMSPTQGNACKVWGVRLRCSLHPSKCVFSHEDTQMTGRW